MVDFATSKKAELSVDSLLAKLKAQERLVAVVRELSLARDLEMIMQIVRRAARELTGADGATFVLKDGNQCYYAEENAITPLWKGRRFPLSECISGWVMLHRQSVAIEDIYQDPRIPQDAYRPTFVKSLLMVPVRQDDPIAAIGNYWATPRMPTEDEVALLQALADTTAVALDNVRVYEQLKASEERFHMLADHIPNLAWMAHADGWVFWFNQRWYEYTGTQLEQIQGWGWQSTLDPDVLPRVLGQWKASLKDSRPGEMIFPIKGADGVFRPFLTRVIPIVDETGKTTCWFGTNTDITVQKNAETALQHLANRLAQSNKELEDFAFVASHDLQAPLRKVQMFSDLLQQSLGDDLSPTSMDYLSRLQKAVKRMQDLISDLLDLSRVNRKGDSFQKLDLAEVAKTVLDDLDADIRDAEATVVVGDLCTLDGDSRQLEQLLKNLLENSIKFRRKDVRPLVKVTSRIENGTCLLTVADNGIGFDEVYKDQIFEVFKRLHAENSEYPGTGIGLSLVKKIVERHNGSIEVHSRPNHGASFTIHLPLIQSHSDV